MRKRFVPVFVVFLSLALGCAAVAQPRRSRGAAAAASAQGAGLVAQLPASDAVMLLDVRRVLDEALPRAFNNNAAELARVRGEIEEFKQKTGIDARQFERVAVGARYSQSPSGATSIDTVALARGNFNTAALVASARAAVDANATREERHAGKTIYVIDLRQQVRLFGLLNVRVTELAFAPLDANTVAVGKLERVREAIDAAAGRGRVSAEIAGLASRNAEAVVGLGGSVPRTAFAGVQFPSEQLQRSVNSIRQFYGSVGMTEAGFRMLAVLRTETAGDARSLSETITGLKQFATPLIGFRYPGQQGALLRGVVEATRVTAQGTEVQVDLALEQRAVAALIEAF